MNIKTQFKFHTLAQLANSYELRNSLYFIEGFQGIFAGTRPFEKAGNPLFELV